MKYIWDPKAQWERDQIADYIYEQFGERRSMKFLDDVDEAVDTMLRFPSIGTIDPLFADRSVTYRSVVVDKLSKMVYRIEDDVIYIAAMWDCRREPQVQAAQVNQPLCYGKTDITR
jgi:plasmid stabilization system protein ParE